MGTEKWYNPTHFANASATEATRFRPPFNCLSRFREPGRVNLNTATDARVWLGVGAAFPPHNDTNLWQQSGNNATIAATGHAPIRTAAL